MRLYTLEEARVALPRVIAILTRLQAVTRELREIAESVGPARQKAVTNGHVPEAGLANEQPEDRVSRLHREAEGEIAALNDLGVVLRDSDRGLIDFMSQREGRVICLCFVLGEDDIRYWHEQDEGFAGRQPL